MDSTLLFNFVFWSAQIQWKGVCVGIKGLKFPWKLSYYIETDTIAVKCENVLRPQIAESPLRSNYIIFNYF